MLADDLRAVAVRDGFVAVDAEAAVEQEEEDENEAEERRGDNELGLSSHGSSVG